MILTSLVNINISKYAFRIDDQFVMSSIGKDKDVLQFVSKLIFNRDKEFLGVSYYIFRQNKVEVIAFRLYGMVKNIS